jgi:hypothetical protein
MKKTEIYVEITNEKERLRAIEILQNAGEEIYKGSGLNNLFKHPFNVAFLESDNEWLILRRIDDETKITLDELEALLTPKKSNVFTDVQEWIRENMPNVTYTFQQNGTPECMKRLEMHLKNDYPKGTEIKISKDKIEIYHS